MRIDQKGGRDTQWQKMSTERFMFTSAPVVTVMSLKKGVLKQRLNREFHSTTFLIS